MDEEIYFENLFRAYYKKMFFFARQMVDDEEECHDIATAVFEAAWKHRSQIDTATAATYLYASTRNLCINHLKRKGVKAEYVEFCKKASEVYAEDDLLAEEEERRETVKRVLAAIKSPTREILVACYVDGKKYREVAEDMGISISTVKKHMVKALKMIGETCKNCKKSNIKAS